MADFLSKLKSNMGSGAEDTSYTSSRHCYAEGGQIGKPQTLTSDRSLKNHSSTEVTASSLKSLWSHSEESVPHFKKGGAVHKPAALIIEIDGGHMIDDGKDDMDRHLESMMDDIEIDGGSMKLDKAQDSKTKKEAKKLARMGRDGDTELVHVNKDEEKLLKAYGGRGSINPKTGLREYPFENNSPETFSSVDSYVTTPMLMGSTIASAILSRNPERFLNVLKAARKMRNYSFGASLGLNTSGGIYDGYTNKNKENYLETPLQRILRKTKNNLTDNPTTHALSIGANILSSYLQKKQFNPFMSCFTNVLSTPPRYIGEYIGKTVKENQKKLTSNESANRSNLNILNGINPGTHNSAVKCK